MDIDPLESADSASDDAAAAAHSRLNTWVAITVALLATFLGICNVKDDNIVQGMQQAQADKIDDWSFYQARNLREEVANATATQLRLQASAQPPALRASFLSQADQFQKLAADQH